jgi:hypothetical protein
MSNKHITAALRCSKFKGTARELLFILADAASPGGKKDDKKILPFGFCKRKLQTLMVAINCKRQPTVSKALKELRDAGAIKTHYKKQASPLFFVDIEWLKANAYSDAELEEFEYSALKEAREKDKQAEKKSTEEPVWLGDRDDLSEGGLPAGDTRVNPPESPDIRKAFNLEYGKRLSSNTESVSEEYGKRLTSSTSSHLRSAQGSVPPAVAGDFPTALRETKHSSKTSASLKDQQQEPPQFLDEEPEAPAHLDEDTPDSVAPLADEFFNPVRTHAWLKGRPAMDDECLNPGCGMTYQEARMSKERCYGEKAEGAAV